MYIFVALHFLQLMHGFLNLVICLSELLSQVVSLLFGFLLLWHMLYHTCAHFCQLISDICLQVQTWLFSFTGQYLFPVFHRLFVIQRLLVLIKRRLVRDISFLLIVHYQWSPHLRHIIINHFSNRRILRTSSNIHILPPHQISFWILLTQYVIFPIVLATTTNHLQAPTNIQCV